MGSKTESALRKELVLFLVLFLLGIAGLPGLIYFVGNSLFGAYAESGFAGFYGAIHRDLRAGGLAAWTLVLTPYLMLLIFRLGAYLYRRVSGMPGHTSR